MQCLLSSADSPGGHDTEAAEEGQVALRKVSEVVQRALENGRRIYIGVGGGGADGMHEMAIDKHRVGKSDTSISWEDEHIFPVGPDYFWARAAEKIAIAAAKETFGEHGVWWVPGASACKVLNQVGGGGGPIPRGAAKGGGSLFILVGI